MVNSLIFVLLNLLGLGAVFLGLTFELAALLNEFALSFFGVFWKFDRGGSLYVVLILFKLGSGCLHFEGRLRKSLKL